MKKITLILIYALGLFCINAEPILEHYKTHKTAEEKFLDFEIELSISGLFQEFLDPESMKFQVRIFEMENAKFEVYLTQNLTGIYIDVNRFQEIDYSVLMQLRKSEHAVNEFWLRLYMMAWSYITSDIILDKNQSVIFFRMIEIAENHINSTIKEQVITLIKTQFSNNKNGSVHIASYGIDMEFLKSLEKYY